VFSTYVVHSYDFVANKSLDLDTAKILDEIQLFCHACPISIRVNHNDDKIEMPCLQANIFDYYSKEQGMQVSIDGTDSLQLFYRNQLIQKPGITIPFLGVKANIVRGNAKDLLSLSRNELSFNAKKEVRQRIINALLEAILKSNNVIPKDLLPKVSMFYTSLASDNGPCPIHLKNAWEKYIFTYYDGQEMKRMQHSFGKILSMAQERNVVWLDYNTNLSPSVTIKKNAIILSSKNNGLDVFQFLLIQLYSTHPYPHNVVSDYTDWTGFLLSKNMIDPIGDYHKWAETYMNNSFYARSFMPCNSRFKVLQVKSTSFPFSFDSTFPISGYPQMICPYIRIVDPDFWGGHSNKLEWNDDNGELYNLTYSIRADESVTIEQIKDAYSEFRKTLDPIIDTLNSKKRK
jgi:hypothetical protein